MKWFIQQMTKRIKATEQREPEMLLGLPVQRGDAPIAMNLDYRGPFPCLVPPLWPLLPILVPTDCQQWSRPADTPATYRSIASWVDKGVFAISDRDDPRWAQVFVGIRNLYDLDDDWDGMDAAKPSHAICDVALRLALACRDHPAPIPSHVAATPAGTILFSWQSLDDYREIEVVGPDHLEWMTVDATDTATHGEWKIEEIPDERTADGALPLHSGNDRGRKADRGRLT